MSGYLSVRELLRAKQPSPGDTLWRSSEILQQLSPNGSLLLAENHDRVWLEAYREIAGGTLPWKIEREVLLALPAWTVRRTLWRASLNWWLAMMSYRKQLARDMIDRGIVSLPESEALDLSLQRSAKQLGDLAWCSRDTSQGRIAVVEEE